jgi:predicted dithiol-disulfide oxidoreductase (DUF899 family)
MYKQAIVAAFMLVQSCSTTPTIPNRPSYGYDTRRDGAIYHTYSTYARGIDMLNVDYHYLDLVPKGRDEGDRGPYWVRRHDEYGR